MGDRGGYHSRDIHGRRTPGWQAPSQHQQAMDHVAQQAGWGAQAAPGPSHTRIGHHDQREMHMADTYGGFVGQVEVQHGSNASRASGLGSSGAGMPNHGHHAAQLDQTQYAEGEWWGYAPADPADGFPYVFPEYTVYTNDEAAMPPFNPAYNHPMPDPLADVNTFAAPAVRAAPSGPVRAAQEILANPPSGSGKNVKHIRLASQDINPTPSKRAREIDENVPPDAQADSKVARARADASSREAPTTAVSSSTPAGAPHVGVPVAPVSAVSAVKPKPAKRSRKKKINNAVVSGPSAGANEDVDGEGGGSASSRWTNEETKLLLEAILGSNSVVKLEKFEKHPDRYAKKVSKKIFNRSRSGESVKRKYMRMRTIFSNIMAFENQTGGGTDPDLPPPPLDWKSLSIGDIEARFEKGRRAGKEFGGLTAALYKHWQQIGWYDYFNNRLASHPNLKRQHEFAGDQLSDQEIGGRRTATEKIVAPGDPQLVDSDESSSDDSDDSDSSSSSSSDVDDDASAPKNRKTPRKALRPPTSTTSATPAKTAAPVKASTPAKAVLPASNTARPSDTGSDAQAALPSTPRAHTVGTPGAGDPPTPISKQPGVPEKRHPGKISRVSSFSNHAGDFFESNSAYLKTVQSTTTAQLELAQRQFTASESRQERKLSLEERQLELQERRMERELAVEEKRLAAEERRHEESRRAARLKDAERLLTDPSTPASIRQVAEKVVLEYLMSKE